MVEIFNRTLFSNLFLKTPTFYGRIDGRSCSCMLYCENHFNFEHDWEDRIMRYTLDLIVVSIGIIGFFQLVSIIDIFLYTHMFLCMYAYISNNINFDWYPIFSYIYVFLLCLLYFYILEHKF